MPKKILSTIIGALLALLVYVIAIMIGTTTLGFQAVTIIILGIIIIGSFIYWKKFAKNEILRSMAIGAFYSSIVYLVIVFAAKTIVFSLVSGITH